MSSLLFVIIKPDCFQDFTPWGTISAFMWVVANTSAMAGVKVRDDEERSDSKMLSTCITNNAPCRSSSVSRLLSQLGLA